MPASDDRRLTPKLATVPSMTSVHGPSPSAPNFTNLNIQATHPPQVRERTRKYPTGQRTPKLATVPFGGKAHGRMP